MNPFPPELFDTHAHLTDPVFETSLDDILSRAHLAGVQRCISIATTVASSRKAIQLAAMYPGVFAAVGIQPNYVAEGVADACVEIEQLCHEPGVVAIGETGLDQYWDDVPFTLQQASFRAHVEMACSNGLPLIIHMREGQLGDGVESCSREIHTILREVSGANGSIRGVMHSFTGTHPMADAFLQLGMHISFAGMLTFKNSAALREVAAKIPTGRLLVETDSPYLTPHPYRGKYPNEPGHIVHTAQCLADLYQMPLAEMARITTANACELFRIANTPEQINR